MPGVTLGEQIACVEREIGLREKHYPRWVKTQKLTQAAADLELDRMRAVLGTLQMVLAQGARPRGKSPIATALAEATAANVCAEVAADLCVEAIVAERERVLAIVAPALHSSRFVRIAAQVRGTSS